MSYSRECDIWSCGVILFLIMSGKQPFKGSTNEETFTNIVNGEFSFEDEAWNDISSDAKDCVTKMLTWDETLRSTAAQMMDHHWIVSNGSSGSIESPDLSEAEATKDSEAADANRETRPTSDTDTESEDIQPVSSPESDEVTESEDQEADEPTCDKSLSLKVSATQFVSHRLGQLTEHYDIIEFIAKGM
jgi:serine/threonine protein kinase